MKMISANCPACGAVYGGRFTSRFITCEYCGTRFAMSRDELDALGFEDKDGDGFDDHDKSSSRRKHEEDTSSAPMYAFAQEACEDFLKSVNRSSFESTTKIKNGLDIKNNDDIYLIHDDTMFKSGKNGFAITYSGIYCREMMGSAHFVSWEDFARGGRPNLEDSYIYQDGTSICYFTDDGNVRDNKLAPLFDRLYDHAQRVL